MRIQPETLKTITSPYEFRTMMAKENRSPEEKEEICLFILSDDKLFQTLTPHWAALETFLDIFSGIRMNPSVEEKIFQKLLSSQESSRKFLENPYFFGKIYKLFVRDELRADIKLARCMDALHQLEKLPATSWVWFTGNRSYLPELINLAPDMQEQILEWALKNKLISSAEDKLNVINKAAELIRIKKEEERKVWLENYLKQVREKVARRHNTYGYFQSDPAHTELHKVVSMISPNDVDIQRAISLIEQGADLEARDKNGETPLISAAIAGNTMMTLMLLSRGAKASVVDNDGYKPQLFKLFYDCDHEYDEGGCIPLKRFMDNPVRHLLEKIEGLESSYLSPENKSYSLGAIKADLLSIMHDAEFQDAKQLAALCGYVFNHVRNEDREAVYHLFKDNCKVDISKQGDLSASLPGKSISTLADYREQLHRMLGNNNNPSINTNQADTAIVFKRR